VSDALQRIDHLLVLFERGRGALGLCAAFHM
jgi:hypothetical protein